MPSSEFRLEISGMSCGSCVNRVRTLLQNAHQLEVLSVTIGHAVVRVLGAPDQTLAREHALLAAAALTAAGFDAAIADV